MTNVAILGFGVVGGGVADLITKRRAEINKITNGVTVRRILDLRDFPNSPYEKLVTHNYDDIINDKEIDTVVECMGGSHPAYEFTLRALQSGKNVITSNKEVVAAYGDEFLRTARDFGVSYRYEAAVGGGIPVISPITSCLRHNKITDIAGILNGTTNYILTKMFTFGDSFETALAEAQEKGYAEKNPDADVLGKDTCRKIAILTAIATGKLISPDKIHTEGIVNIRRADVAAAESLGCSIKLLGRCSASESTVVMVAPYMIPNSSQLGTVSGVFNAVSVTGEPIGEVVFYGRGAGAGPTASAIVQDIIQIAMGENKITPSFEKCDYDEAAYLAFTSQNYFAIDGIDRKTVREIFGNVQFIENCDELAFVSAPLSESAVASLSERAEKMGAKILSRIRLY